MAALGHLRRAGLTVECVADRLRVSPVERITDPMRQFIREHLTELLAELSAANDSTHTSTIEPKRAAWRITRAGQPIGYMVGQPMTYSAALAAVRWRWPDAKLDDAPEEPSL
ncbi:hypothetical protein NA643_04525 [Pseudomonas stutzeri]|uniref:hypothetical protein n=1 Tax=Stutzerimonas stutzeri TaxID=316 RepID=UPI000C9B7D2A|nr:hypothetical protein [Stutzerimonas stutzeri]MCQ4278341.1 hypothetical protein [Stutzerimonas stutzeri]PNF72577.1 hypothetical protein CXK96_11285 [Stutzerimonas stutzeri]